MMIRVVHKTPGQPAEVVNVDNSLESFQGLLDGGYLEAVFYPRTGVFAYIDEEGKLKGLPLNFYVGSEPIVGPAVFSKTDDEGEDIGLTEAEAAAVCASFNGS